MTTTPPVEAEEKQDGICDKCGRRLPMTRQVDIDNKVCAWYECEFCESEEQSMHPVSKSIQNKGNLYKEEVMEKVKKYADQARSFIKDLKDGKKFVHADSKPICVEAEYCLLCEQLHKENEQLRENLNEVTEDRDMIMRAKQRCEQKLPPSPTNHAE